MSLWRALLTFSAFEVKCVRHFHLLCNTSTASFLFFLTASIRSHFFWKKHCPISSFICTEVNFQQRVSCQNGIFLTGPHTWLLPFVIVSRPSVDKEEDGRGRGPTGVAGCGWLTCETISSDSQRSNSSLTSLSVCSLWVSESRPRRSSWQKKTKQNCIYSTNNRATTLFTFLLKPNHSVTARLIFIVVVVEDAGSRVY